MINQETKISLNGMLGLSGSKPVFIGFAPASLLCSLSFSDVLDEATGNGYQRRFNSKHSLDFRKYIQGQGSSTIPLSFNLRPRNDGAWHIEKNGEFATLHIRSDMSDILSQVDCQHRLGHLADLETPLPFMTYIGLTPDEEMQIFSIINGKSKGLNTSLLDFHDSKLIKDLGKEKPELLVAIRLNDEKESPWYKQLDLGGNRTSGMSRRASLRTMQKAVKRFIKATDILEVSSADDTYKIICAFWKAITVLLEEQWNNPRKHFLTKGIGVYSLMSLAGDIYSEASRTGVTCDELYFTGVLSDFVGNFDWATSGPLKGLGGEVGANEALDLLRKLRSKSKFRVIESG